jgi:hypothetical protein
MKAGRNIKFDDLCHSSLHCFRCFALKPCVTLSGLATGLPHYEGAGCSPVLCITSIIAWKDRSWLASENRFPTYSAFDSRNRDTLRIGCNLIVTRLREINGFQRGESVIRITAVGGGWAGTVAAAKEKDKVERSCTSAAAIATNKIQNRSLRPNRK